MSPPPLAFRLARALIRHETPGAWKLMGGLKWLGLLDRVATLELGGGVSLDAPLWRSGNQWDTPDLLAYDPPLIDDLAEAAQTLPQPLVFIDCGADVGEVSVLLAARVRLDRLIAFEPNAEAFLFLRQNMARLPVGEAHRAAVADFLGRGELRSPAHDPRDHARFVIQADPGDFPVVTIDSLGLAGDGGLLLKIDVEGGELAVLHGAAASLHAAAGFAVSFEAQRDQVARVGIEPMEVVRFLEAIRPCEVTVSDLPGFRPRRDRPFFAQIPEVKSFGYNLMCRAIAP